MFFMEKLEKVTKGTIDKNDVQEVSFAEQFLESPVFAGGRIQRKNNCHLLYI